MTVTNEKPEMLKILNDLQIELDPSIKLSEAPYSLLSTTDIPAGSLLAKIPQDSILSIKNTAISEILESEHLTGLIGLAITILYERSNPNSPWYDYLKAINQSEYLPILWSEEHKLLLGNTDVGNSLSEDISSLGDDYENIIKPLVSKFDILPKITLEEYMNASSLVTSRGFFVDEERGECVIPFGDLLNHSLVEDVHFTNDDEDEDEWESDDEVSDPGDDEIPEAEVIDKQAMVISDPVMEMVSIKDIKSGQEIFNTYGRHGNSDLLRLYGFCLENNHFDYVQVDRNVILAKVDDNEDRIDFWNQVGGAVVEQLIELEEENDQDEDMEGSGCDDEQCQDEHCQDNHDDDHDEQSHDGSCPDEDCQDEDCQDENCQDCHDDESSIPDDFSFESNSSPSFSLYSFIHILLLPEAEFVEMAMELEKTIDYLVKIKNLLVDNKPALIPRVDEIIVEIAKERLAGYPEWKGTKGKDKVVEYVKILRDGEMKILNGVVEKYQK